MAGMQLRDSITSMLPGQLWEDGLVSMQLQHGSRYDCNS